MHKILACHWCLLRCTAWGGRAAVTCWTTSLGTVPHSSLRFSLLYPAKICFFVQCREYSWRRRSLPWLSCTPVCCQRIDRMGRMLLLCQLCALCMIQAVLSSLTAERVFCCVLAMKICPLPIIRTTCWDRVLYFSSILESQHLQYLNFRIYCACTEDSHHYVVC